MKIDGGLHELNRLASNMNEEKRISVENKATLGSDQMGAVRYGAIIVQNYSMEASN